MELRSLYDIPGITQYLERLKKQPGSDGGQPYDYRYNANAFCRKVFAQDAVFDEDEHVFWFDADAVALQKIPAEFLQGLVGEHALAYLGRQGEQTYTETGFVGFNTKHPDFQKFRGAYLPYFTTGKIFGQLKGWHDCIAFDHARQGVSSRNLSPKGHGFSNVIVESLVGPYVMHYKGKRKYR